MTSTSSPPEPNRFDISAWLPGRRTLLWTAIAFAAGLLLFLLVLLRGRDGEDFYRPGDQAPPTASTPRYNPLPAPIDDGDGASGMGETPAPLDADGDRPQLVETAPPPLPPGPATPADAAMGAVPEPDGAAPPAAMTREPQPIPGQTPAPNYPSASLRRGETGTVIVSATIGTDGKPRRIDVAGSSGSRRLDRAARDAVRRWRFQPALSNGQPIEANVNIPIEFKR